MPAFAPDWEYALRGCLSGRRPSHESRVHFPAVEHSGFPSQHVETHPLVKESNQAVFRQKRSSVAMALLAGGGMRNGQVIGSTDRLGGEATSRPVTFGEVFATLYHNLGIDVNSATVEDAQGRPQSPINSGTQPIPELV